MMVLQANTTKTKRISLEDILVHFILLLFCQQHLRCLNNFYNPRSIPRRTSVLWETTSLDVAIPPHPISKRVHFLIHLTPLLIHLSLQVYHQLINCISLSPLDGHLLTIEAYDLKRELVR